MKEKVKKYLDGLQGLSAGIAIWQMVAPTLPNSDIYAAVVLVVAVVTYWAGYDTPNMIKGIGIAYALLFLASAMSVVFLGVYQFPAIYYVAGFVCVGIYGVDAILAAYLYVKIS